VGEHLEQCVRQLPTQPGCEQVRETYGRCPDHDGLCAPGCPIGDPSQEGGEAAGKAP
jgi:hypothetical protein